MSEHTLCGAEVEFAAETRQLLENLKSREPAGNAAEFAAIRHWWGGAPNLPLGPQYPHHEACQLEDAFMRWLKLTAWLQRHPAGIVKRVGLTAVTWLRPEQNMCAANTVQCCVTQVVAPGIIEGRAYRFITGLQNPPLPIKVELGGWAGNTVGFKNLLECPVNWPVECAAARWVYRPYQKTRDELQTERENSQITFEESEIPTGPAPWTLQDPTSDAFLEGLESLLAWGEHEYWRGWGPNADHPDQPARFEAAQGLCTRIKQPREQIMPTAFVGIEEDGIPVFYDKLVTPLPGRGNTEELFIPYQFLLPGIIGAELPTVSKIQVRNNKQYPAVRLDFGNVPAKQVFRFPAQDMRRISHPRFDVLQLPTVKVQNDSGEETVRLWDVFIVDTFNFINDHAVNKTSRTQLQAAMPEILSQHPGYRVHITQRGGHYCTDQEAEDRKNFKARNNAG